TTPMTMNFTVAVSQVRLDDLGWIDAVALDAVQRARPDAGEPELADDLAGGVDAVLLELEDLLHRDHARLDVGDLGDAGDAALAGDAAVGPRTQRVLDQVARDDLALAFDVRRARFQAHDVALLQLQLGGVLDGEHAFGLRNEGRQRVQHRRLARAGAARDQAV